MVTPLKFVGDERALVEALRGGHPGAVAALYERYASAVHRTLRSALGPDAELPDLLQEVLGEKSAREPRAEPTAAPKQDAPITEDGGKEDRSSASSNRSGAAATNNTGAQLACGGLYSPDGASAALELGLSLYHFFGEHWGVGLDLALPLRRGEVTGVEGSAKMGAHFAGPLLLARLQHRANPLFATVGAGPALLLVSYEGTARAPLRSSAGSQMTAAAYLRGDVGIEVAPWLRLGLRALAGASFQRLSVRFAGNEAGNFGRALFAGFAFVEASSP